LPWFNQNYHFNVLKKIWAFPKIQTIALSIHILALDSLAIANET
jgi:hypothetical protein